MYAAWWNDDIAVEFPRLSSFACERVGMMMIIMIVLIIWWEGSLENQWEACFSPKCTTP